MRSFRLQILTLASSLVAVAALVATSTAPSAHAQTNTTSAIAGVVTDSTGAVVPGAIVKAINTGTGEIRTTTTDASGSYRLSQLSPGRYTVTAAAGGFEKSSQTIDVSLAAVLQGNFILSVGQANTTVEVTSSEVPLIHVDDAQISTTFTEQQVQLLPNPGNDLTFQAQTAPGSVMNTQGGYGNFSSFGLPATSNTFTVNGGYYNDPFLNVNNSGATNLTLGNNDIESVTVTSNAYNASFGGLGGAQVSEISRSGTNQFHGNANYWWNGRVMNANDYFNKEYNEPRNFDNVNQWAAAVGGPIKRNKTFFFANYEGLDVVLPARAIVYAPDATYQSTVLANLTANGLSSEIPIYTNIFNLFNNAKGYSSAEETPVPAGVTCTPYCTVNFNATAGNYTHEWLFNGRIDQDLGTNDHLFGHMTSDHGVQATYTNVLNPIFDAFSPQPAWEGQLSETHTFTPSLVNTALFSAIHYDAFFTNTNLAASEAIVPFSLIFANGNMASNGGGAWPGGENIVWPQGRDVFGYQFQDDLSWTKGEHTLSVGWVMRRDDLTDYDIAVYSTSPEAVATAAAPAIDPATGLPSGPTLPGSFEEGYVDEWYQQFPTRSSEPIALYTMGWYAQDQWKALPNLTITYGLRMEHNSNPLCRTNCFARLSGSFASVSTSTTTPYNTMITSGLTQALPSLQKIGFEPRVGFDYLPAGANSRTTLRGGFGMFDDSFPGQIADDLFDNAPTNVGFTLYGPAFGGTDIALVPSAPGSAESVAAASDKAFASGFANGATNTTLSSLPGFSVPNVTSAVSHISNPTYEEWSFAVERELTTRDSIQVMYVGNHSYLEPVQNNSLNAWNSGGALGFPELSTSGPPNPNFASVNQISSEASGNYNGLIVSAQHRSRSLTVSVNYDWSHALDEISNGGFDGFSGNSVNPDNPFNLASNYGNADYDTPQYVSGNYVYTLPHYGGPKLLVDNWVFSGTVFHSLGLPFSVIDGLTADELSGYGGPLFAQQTASIAGHTHCGGTAAASATPTPCAFAADYTSATDFGQSGRNQIFGPNYTDTDFAVTKGFTMPHWDEGQLKVGAQFFNLFNHPNFGQPLNNLSAGSSLGTITTDVNSPTSILGSFLGGDADPRLIQFEAKFTF